VKTFRWIIGSLLLACSLPLCGLLLAGTLANVLGCTLNEADVHPCSILGVPIGPVLYALSALGWLMILSLPLGAVALVTWIGAESVGFVRKRMEGSVGNDQHTQL
jgi:hypothetical protein